MGVQGIAELVSLFFMASALSMDAFSMSLGIGMKKLRLKRIFIIGIVVGAFHMIMPLIGIVLGQYLSSWIGEWTNLIAGLLLFVIGAQMFFQAFQVMERAAFQPVGLGLILFSLTVSIDSFSVGLSLGMSEMKTLIIISMFSFTSMCATWLGLCVARKVSGFLGKYGELLGGSILAAFGLYFIFG